MYFLFWGFFFDFFFVIYWLYMFFINRYVCFCELKKIVFKKWLKKMFCVLILLYGVVDMYYLLVYMYKLLL